LASEIDFAITSRNETVAPAECALNPPAPKKARGIPMPNVRVLATDLEFPEGPVVLPDGSVVLVEIRGRRLTRVWPDGRKQVVAEIPGGPNGAAMGPDG
jgi:sugar lactone lactonase YvrE